MGEWDVDRMLAGMTVSQFREWQCYFSLEESGPLRDDLRSAKIVAAIYNCAFGRTKETPTIHPEDVYGSLAPEPAAAQTPAEMRAAMGVNRQGKKGGDR